MYNLYSIAHVKKNQRFSKTCKTIKKNIFLIKINKTKSLQIYLEKIKNNVIHYHDFILYIYICI